MYINQLNSNKMDIEQDNPYIDYIHGKSLLGLSPIQPVFVTGRLVGLMVDNTLDKTPGDGVFTHLITYSEFKNDSEIDI